jgi:hypothetical protein
VAGDGGYCTGQKLNPGSAERHFPSTSSAGDTQAVREIVWRHRLLVIGLLFWLLIAAVILLFHYLDGGGPVIAT